MKSFEYHEPSSVEEAVQLLVEYGPESKLLAGGTDLIVEFLHGSSPPDHIISLSKIVSLDFIERNGALQIGAGTTMHRIACSTEVRRMYGMLAEGAALIGSRQIRNLATIGGNICNAVPSADTAPPLLAADAQIVIAGEKGQRRLPITNFFKGPRETVLGPDEIVVKFILTEMPHATGSIYRRFTPRKALDLAMVGVAVCITLEPEGEVIRDARIALGAVAPTPLRALDAERKLVGTRLSESLLKEVANLAVRASKPISDVRGSADYRKDIIHLLTCKCVAEALERASIMRNGAIAS